MQIAKPLFQYDYMQFHDLLLEYCVLFRLIAFKLYKLLPYDIPNTECIC